MHTTDVLILGKGNAGLRAAIAAARQGATVTVLHKGGSASHEIMGFNAHVLPEDSAELYFEDTCASGQGINDPAVSRVLADRVRGEMEFLESIGFRFDREEGGGYAALHTLGCRHPRLVHDGALTGIHAAQRMQAECERLGVAFLNNVMAVDILLDAGRAAGVLGLSGDGEPVACLASAVVLATGGCGAMHRTSTYPRAVTGDGYAMAYRAGAELVDMEFQQFEPCAFLWPGTLCGKVIPTTLLRAGAKLVNGQREEFLHRYGLSRENAQKGELARAIHSEVLAGRGTPHGGVYYDVSMMPRDLVVVGHSIFYDPALAAGLDLMKEPAEVAPAAHTNLGGVRIDSKCRTEMPGLFAAGEVTGGVHGANRIGGSAGAETLVYGGIAGESAAAFASKTAAGAEGAAPEALAALKARLKGLAARPGTAETPETVRDALGRLMQADVGIVRDAAGLERAEASLDRLSQACANARAQGREAAQLLQLENMLTVARMQVRASRLRKESRGVFYRSDYPNREEAWTQNIRVRLQNGEMALGLAKRDTREMEEMYAQRHPVS